MLEKTLFEAVPPTVTVRGVPEATANDAAVLIPPAPPPPVRNP
jgi:hypothetical protein